MLKTKLAGTETLVSYAFTPNDAVPTSAPKASTGIFDFSDTRSPNNDAWYSMSLQDNGFFSFVNNDINVDPLVLIAVILSLLIALGISYTSMKIIIFGFNSGYYKAKDAANHLIRYSHIEKEKKK